MNWIHLISVLAAAASIAPAEPMYTLTDLGTLGGSSSIASGLNNAGLAIGSATTPAGYFHAFSSVGNGSGWTDLTANSGTSMGLANAVNNFGLIAGAQTMGGESYATVWNNGVASTVAGAGSYAMAINDSGQIAGELTTASGQGHAFVTENGVVVDLGTFGGGSWSAAYGINAPGDAAGYGQTTNGFRAFLWTSGGMPGTGYIMLGTLGGANSYGMAVNDARQVAGNAQVSSGYAHAFVSTGTSMKDLGTLGGNSSYAYGINNQGNIVGDSWIIGNEITHAFLYENGIMYDLNSLIQSPGWVITAAYGINGSNQIVGTATFDGVEHAVLLTDPPLQDDSPVTSQSNSTVPEPATWIATMTGLGALFRIGQQRRNKP